MSEAGKVKAKINQLIRSLKVNYKDISKLEGSEREEMISIFKELLKELEENIMEYQKIGQEESNYDEDLD